MYFNQLTYSINENSEVVQVGLVLSNPSSTDITVKVSDYGNTAAYTIKTSTVTFAAGTTIATFNVSINDDTIAESNKKFTLTVDPYSLPIGITVGYPYQTTVTIMDDDRK